MTQSFEDSRREYLFGNVEILRGGRQACPACGHPTGDCAPHKAAPHHIWGVTDVPSLEDSTAVLVEEDVFEYRQITPFTKSRVLVARAGQQISVSRARELGII